MMLVWFPLAVQIQSINTTENPLSAVTVCVFTKSLKGVGHGLVLHHVDESSTEAEVREDEEDILQNVVDSSDLLQRQPTAQRFHSL